MIKSPFINGHLTFDNKIVELCNHYSNVLCNLNLNSKSYNLSISGVIGGGKSTMLTLLYNIFSNTNYHLYTYPEYLHVGNVLGKPELNKHSHECLNKRLDGTISAFTFQHYILDMWHLLFTHNDNLKLMNTINGSNNVHVSLFERLPTDSLYSFVKRDYDNGHVSKEEFRTLFNRCRDIAKDHSIPVLNGKLLSIINYTNTKPLNESLCDVMNIVIDDLTLGNVSDSGNHTSTMDRVIRLVCDIDTSYERVMNRNRGNETSTYDKDYLKLINSYCSSTEYDNVPYDEVVEMILNE